MRQTWLATLVVPAGVIAAIVLLALAAPLLPLADPVRMDVAHRLVAPSLAHPLGQDEYGRDVLARIIWGARASLAVAVSSALLAGVIGTALGLFGGYFRGLVELVTIRASEMILCLPPLLLALLVVTLLGPGAATLIVALTILYTPGYARVVYAQTLAVRSLDFVTAQEVLGAHPLRILARTVLPNVMPPLLVQASLTIAAAMVLESGLSFLGLGVVPPSPSWGLMIRSARATMDHAPLLLLWPCLALSGTIILLNLLCDRLRDVLDPRSGGAGAPWLGGLRERILPGLKTPLYPVDGALLRVEGLSIALASDGGVTRVVRDVSLTVAPSETVALVGESGSGKTLTGLALMGLLPPGVEVVEGAAGFTTRDGRHLDLLRLSEAKHRLLRGDQISMVFQDASASLDPVHRVGGQVAEAIRAHRAMPASQARGESVALLRGVGLPDAERRADAYPHELSGGQRQRVMIAAAIANHPRLLIADEPTTALDTTVQRQILDLLARLKQREGGMGMIFVTHNLAIVTEIADRVCVMYAGEIVEQGPVAEVFARPRHPYTAALLDSVPEGDAERLVAIPGTIPGASDVSPGCRFAPRCGHATGACGAAAPGLESLGGGRVTRCLRWRELAA
jgi:peptide/nickel transport system permease protein